MEPTAWEKNPVDSTAHPNDISKPKIRSEIPFAIPRSKIHPWADQPRQYFSEASVLQLADSFEKHGFKGTLVVRPHPDMAGDYQLIAGERRYLAAKLAGIESILCFIGDFADEAALDFSLCENLNREDLSKLEETLGILRLIEARFNIPPEKAILTINTEGHNDKAAGRKTHISKDLQAILSVLQQLGVELQTFRTAHLPTLKLPDILKKAHLEDGLSYLSAKALSQVTQETILQSLLEETLSQKLSVRKVRARVKETLRADTKEPVQQVELGDQGSVLGIELGELKAVMNRLFESKNDIEQDAAKVRIVKRLIEELKKLLT